MKEEYFNDIIGSDLLIQAEVQCKNLVKGALLKKMEQHNMTSLVVENPRRTPLQLFICGGYGDEKRSVTVYDFADECWRELAGLEVGRYEHGVGVVGGKVYVVGGWVGGSASASCVMYDLVSDTWSTYLANMETSRVGHGVAVVKNCIYSVGGRDARYSPLNTCEVYNRVYMG